MALGIFRWLCARVIDVTAVNQQTQGKDEAVEEKRFWWAFVQHRSPCIQLAGWYSPKGILDLEL